VLLRYCYHLTLLLTGSELKSIIINSADNIKIDKGVVKKLNAYEAVKQVGYTTDIFNTTILSDDEIKIDGLNVNYEGVFEDTDNNCQQKSDSN